MSTSARKAVLLPSRTPEGLSRVVLRRHSAVNLQLKWRWGYKGGKASLPQLFVSKLHLMPMRLESNERRRYLFSADPFSWSYVSSRAALQHDARGRGPYIALVLERMKGKVHVVERLASRHVSRATRKNTSQIEAIANNTQYERLRLSPVLNGCSGRHDLSLVPRKTNVGRYGS